MVLDILLIVLGTTTTIILAFVSHKADSKLIKYLFWFSLLTTVGIVIYSGISGIKLNTKINDLRTQVQKYKPFHITDNDKDTLTIIIKELVTAESREEKAVPKIHFLTFPGQSADAVEFQEILKSALELTGKKIYSHHNLRVTGTHLDGTPWNGIVIQVNDLKNPPLIAQGIYSILNKLKIKTWSNEGAGYGNNDIVIYSHRPIYNNKK